MTQKELAERSGLTREAVAYLETGHNEPRWKTVVALCAALGVTSDQFLKPPGTRAVPSSASARGSRTRPG
jgi:transcriptional regulator with XRE-family HTH domain